MSLDDLPLCPDHPACGPFGNGRWFSEWYLEWHFETGDAGHPHPPPVPNLPWFRDQPPEGTSFLPVEALARSRWMARGEAGDEGWTAIDDPQTRVLALLARTGDVPVLCLEPARGRVSIIPADERAFAAAYARDRVGPAYTSLARALRQAEVPADPGQQMRAFDRALDGFRSAMLAPPYTDADMAADEARYEARYEALEREADEQDRLGRRYEVQGGAPGLGRRGSRGR